jgi:electron transfer flavoprotein beta subunit
MPDIIACFKWVIDEAYLKSDSSGNIDFDWVDYKLSDYDKNAIEEAVRLTEEYGGEVVAVTVGTPDDTKGIKDALARGPGKAVFINDPAFAGLESSQTAGILAEVISSRLKYDLIICGEGSSDLYAQQVGPRLAERLGIPSISYVTKVSLNNDTVIAERKMEDGIEVVTAPLPALITVSPQINTPRIPGLKDTLAASKKPVVQVQASELQGDFAPLLETVGIRKADMERKCKYLSCDAKGIAEMANVLQQTGAND